MKKILAALMVLLVFSAFAQETTPLYEGIIPNNKKEILLDEQVMTFPTSDGDVHFITNTSQPELTIYLPEKSINTGSAVIICPGGGYSGVAIDHEGHWIAKKLAENGIAGFVLKYRQPLETNVDHKEIVPLQDAQQAIQLVRSHANQWNISIDKVGIMGSSAGGHLAATAATHYAESYIENSKNISLRPDFLILNYPVISFSNELTHFGSRINLIGEMSYDQLAAILQDQSSSEKKLKEISVSESKIIEFSNDLHVSNDTPPTFITHSIDDPTVKINNSLVFIAALQENKVPVETYFYKEGGHGYGMTNPTTEKSWLDKCIPWIMSINNLE